MNSDCTTADTATDLQRYESAKVDYIQIAFVLFGSLPKRRRREHVSSRFAVSAVNFFLFRLQIDTTDDSEAIRTAALSGTPSEQTLWLAERAGFCTDWFRSWFAFYANAAH